MAKQKTKKAVEAITHKEASRKNIPTAEHQPVMREEEQAPIAVAYERRNRDLDPQLVWRGKDEQDQSKLEVRAPPLYIQEKVHPKVIIDDLRCQTEAKQQGKQPHQLDLFADFNGLPDDGARTEFYQHDANWTNRMILGDSLQVMASLAEREGLRGKVQCIYLDPPYGIKFNSNFQWSTTSRDVKDGNVQHITREPEQVKAFRDTWRDGIHSYLAYLRDRLTVARDLLTESGSIFVQIGDENVHRVRCLMDEVFGEDNFISIVQVQKTGSLSSNLLANTVDFILWYAKSKEQIKYRQLFNERIAGHVSSDRYDHIEFTDGTAKRLKKKELNRTVPIQAGRIFRHTSLISSGKSSTEQIFNFQGGIYKTSRSNHWKTTLYGLGRLAKAKRIDSGKTTIYYKRYLDDFSVLPINDRWESLQIGTGLVYVVQTAPSVIQRCILMSTDPGDLVLDPTCGSGTTAYVAEQWGRRWITIDTSRVALALARARIMGGRYPYYLLADSPEGQQKEAEITRTAPSDAPAYGNIRQGFVYQRVPHIMLKDIANNAEIDIIWDEFQEKLEPLRQKLNKLLKQEWQEWEIPRESEDEWPEQAKKLHKRWWTQRIARQKEIDASIAAKADCEYLYDKPYEDRKKVRVSGPFTVESISPHRVLTVDENDEHIDPLKTVQEQDGACQDFAGMVLDNLKTAGVQQAHKEDRISFTSVTPWPGHYICAEGQYEEAPHPEQEQPEERSHTPHSGFTVAERSPQYATQEVQAREKRAAIFVGPEFGTVSRADLVAATREAGDAGFDTLIACAFSYDAHSSEFDKLGRIPVLKARMNADLHMADDLKNTGQGNLFVIFGEPDISILEADDRQIQVRINGVDVFHPATGEIRSDDTSGIACWFIDSDYNEESFFVRHAYFLGANDPYKALKTTLKAEIDKDSWDTLNSDTSRPFPKPASGRIAVKVINHLGDEVMKVFRVEHP